MDKPALEAVRLLNSLGYTQPNDMCIEDIAWASGLTVTKKEMDASEGRILMTETEAVITINSSITYQPKINFVLAHEIGHAFLHRGRALFSDNAKTLSDWYAKGPHESEANEFAIELLMPENLFIKKVKGRKLDLPLVESVAEYFCASKTAAFLRYKDLGDYPLMVIFIENGIIKWKSLSEDFPFRWLEHNSKVPAFTVAGDLYYKGVEERRPAKIDALEWFPDDYSLQNSHVKQVLWEQCFKVSDTGILTCLWCK